MLNNIAESIFFYNSHDSAVIIIFPFPEGSEQERINNDPGQIPEVENLQVCPWRAFEALPKKTNLCVCEESPVDRWSVLNGTNFTIQN